MGSPWDTGIARVGSLQPGTHLGVFYETEQDFLQILFAFFRAGSQHNLWIVGPPHDQQSAATLLPADLRGRVEIVAFTDFYLEQGRFSRINAGRRWRDCLEMAKDKGLRAVAQESWLRDEDWEEFSEYEGELASTFASRPVLALCAYPLALISGKLLLDFARSHEWSLAYRRGRWETLESPPSRERRLALERMVEERTAQLRSLAGRLQSAREDEAARISRELHDHFGSTLTSLRWSLDELQTRLPDQFAPNLDAVQAQVDSLIESVRKIAAEIRPPILDLGLVEAIRWQTEQFSARSGIECDFQTIASEIPLPAPAAAALFRILQEALTNVLRHSGATHVTVCLECEAEHCTMRVRDNGRGQQEGARGGLGLLGIQERVHLLAGSVAVRSEPQRGFELEVRIPVSCIS